ncbi:cell wall-binding repeat-containing protein [Euzebya sp.]|uniref:cell wall-binding repeat-containing protein n=1 Tax=Euzebya sp. TaxID=1971409 RepID=UPI0035110998
MQDRPPAPTPRRLLALLMGAVLLLALAPAAGATTARAGWQQADLDAAEAAAGDWLVGQYEGGAVTGGGALADLIFALTGAEAAPPTVDAAAADLEAAVTAYVDAGGEDEGTLAKALLAVEVAGGDGGDVGGTDLEAALRDLEQADGADAGRIADASVFTQSLAVMALATTDGGAPATTVEWLAAQACPEGGFPFGPVPDTASSCEAGGTDVDDADVDTTAVAVQALGVDPAGEAAREASVAWLLDQQADDGSLAGNANSTGLAAQALRAAGQAGAADDAAAYVAGLQIPAGEDDAGAIRFRGDADGSLFLATSQGILAFGAPAFWAMAPAPAPDPVGAPCEPGAGVTVFVDLTAFDAGVRQGCAEEDPADGLAALEAAGFEIITQDTDFGPYVCAIDGFPELACDQPFEGSFWSYFAGAADGTWTTRQVGARDTDPPPGEVEGWAYSDGSPPTVPAPAPTLPASVTRLAGDTRLATAIAISRASTPDGGAGGVVLARADEFADALAGTPLAVAVDGPLLLTPSDALAADVAAEIQRVLPPGGRVDVLGGSAAIDEAVVQQVADLGYDVQRRAGADRVTTAIAVAEALGDPSTLLITTGFAFPDALAAGTAAAVTGDGAVLLTGDGTPHPAVTEYLAANPDATAYAVGGPAATAHPEATPVVGASREETSVAVARTFFDQPGAVGIARSDAFADALAGGAHLASLGAPLLLTPTGTLAPAVGDYLCTTGSLDAAVLLGGEAAVTTGVGAQAGASLDGCEVGEPA